MAVATISVNSTSRCSVFAGNGPTRDEMLMPPQAAPLDVDRTGYRRLDAQGPDERRGSRGRSYVTTSYRSRLAGGLHRTDRDGGSIVRRSPTRSSSSRKPRVPSPSSFRRTRTGKHPGDVGAGQLTEFVGDHGEHELAFRARRDQVATRRSAACSSASRRSSARAFGVLDRGADQLGEAGDL